MVILVGRPDAKSWWRNFVGGGDLDVLIAGRWREFHAEAIVGADAPERAGPLLDAYIERFPRAARSFGEAEDRGRHADVVVVACTPRPPKAVLQGRSDDEHRGSSRAFGPG